MRSRNGCKTCRIRKIRCDEARPSCKRCSSTGRTCDGPSEPGLIVRPYRAPSTSLTRKAPAQNSFLAPGESRAFDFYLKCAAPALGGHLDKQFWSYIIPQLCQSNVTVKDAVLAISTLYEHPLLNSYKPPPIGIVYTQDQRRGVNWYAKSVSNVLTHRNGWNEVSDIESGLLNCLLFTSIEVQHANFQSTFPLLERGLKLAAHYTELNTSSGRQTPLWMNEVVLPALVRQAVLFGIFGHALGTGMYTALNRLIASGPTPINSLHDARSSIFAILIQSFAYVQCVTEGFRRNPRSANLQYRDRQAYLTNWMRIWVQEFSHFIISRPSTPQQSNVFHVLLSYERIAYLWVTRCPNNGHMYGDSEEEQVFISILNHARSALSGNTAVPDTLDSSFQLDIGVVHALLFVGWQCQNPALRLQAISLMKDSPDQENLLVTSLQVRTLERLAAYEAGRLTGMGEIPTDAAAGPQSSVRAPHDPQQSVEVVDRSLWLPRTRPMFFDATG